MATIEFITKRIEGTENNIKKLEAKLNRINEAKATNWKVNPYYYNESDIKRTQRDIDETRATLQKYIDDLAIANEKAQSRNVPVITEFLNRWKQRATDYYMEGLENYFKDSARYDEAMRKASDWDLEPSVRKQLDEELEVIRKEWKENCTGRYELVADGNRQRRVKVAEGKYEYLAPYNYERTLEEAKAKLEKDLQAEMDRKYDFIIERTNKLVGKIEDASGLKLGRTGELNGFIVGSKGKAKVQTIGAGGYNIQCFHFRTLINKAK